MDTRTIVAIALVAVVVLAALFVLTTGARRDRGSALGKLSRETRRSDRRSPVVDRLGGDAQTGGEDLHVATGREVERAAVSSRRGGLEVAPKGRPPAERQYLDDEAVGVTRRQFFNRSIFAMFGLGLSGFGAASIAFLWPTLSGGFGSKIRAGELSDVLSQIRDSGEPVYVPEGRFYLNPYPSASTSAASEVYTGSVLEGMEAGVVALYQKCVHLGCRVPWCATSQWFECPCHGSQYNRVGEKTGGPAPRGLDRFGVEVSGGQVVVDTKLVIQGPPVGVDTTGQQAEGPHCA